MQRKVSFKFYPYRYTLVFDGSYIIEQYDITKHDWEIVEKRFESAVKVKEYVEELNNHSEIITESYIVDDLTPFKFID